MYNTKLNICFINSTRRSLYAKYTIQTTTGPRKWERTENSGKESLSFPKSAAGKRKNFLSKTFGKVLTLSVSLILPDPSVTKWPGLLTYDRENRPLSDLVNMMKLLSFGQTGKVL